MFNSVRTAISKAEWYEAGYLANLTAYAVAKLSLEISKDPRAAAFDLLRIWENQSVSDVMLAEAVSIARVALRILTSEDRLVVNVTEWAKRESAWKRLASTEYELSDAFLLDCLPVRLNSSGQREVTVNSRFDPEVSERRHVENICEANWRSVRSYLEEHSLLTGSEQRCLREVIPATTRLLDIEVARELLRIYVKALNNGYEELAG